MTRLAFKNPLLDAHLLRVVGTASAGGADRDECLETAHRVTGTSLDSWYAEWTATADAVLETGQREEALGHLDVARAAYLRASNYYRNAGVMLLGSPVDPRLTTSHARQTEVFQRAASLLARPPERVAIPYEGVTLPGYVFRAGEGRRATVILTGGYDGTAEELYLLNGAAALARGYNVIAFDGPGQGAALIDQGLHMRHDWEAAVTPVVDIAVARPDVDPARIALIGLSLGAHLAPRAASEEHRLAACIADCGAYDLYAAFLGRLPGILSGRFDRGDGLAVPVVRIMLERIARDPTGGWALRRGMLIHGASGVLDYVEMLRSYTLEGRGELIRCPTWVCRAQNDDISATAGRLVDALSVPHGFVEFTAAEGAGDHCEAGNRELYHARSFGWLDALLEPGRVLPA